MSRKTKRNKSKAGYFVIDEPSNHPAPKRSLLLRNSISAVIMQERFVANQIRLAAQYG